MGWIIVGLVIAFLVRANHVLKKREERQPLRMPFRSGHVQGMGEAPPTIHHRLGCRG